MSANQGSGPPPLGPRHWPAWLGVGAMALLARLPWSWQRALGTPLGALLRALLGERRRIALRHLELCFPGLDAAAREALMREHFRSLAIGVYEFAPAWWGSVDHLRRGFEVEGLDQVRQRDEQGRSGWGR